MCGFIIGFYEFMLMHGWQLIDHDFIANKFPNHSVLTLQHVTSLSKKKKNSVTYCFALSHLLVLSADFMEQMLTISAIINHRDHLYESFLN